MAGVLSTTDKATSIRLAEWVAVKNLQPYHALFSTVNAGPGENLVCYAVTKDTGHEAKDIGQHRRLALDFTHGRHELALHLPAVRQYGREMHLHQILLPVQQRGGRAPLR